MSVSAAAPTSLRPSLPDYLARPEFAQLVVLLRHAPRGAFVFALYNAVPAREGVVAALRELVAPIPVFEYTLHRGRRNPLEYLERMPPDMRQQPAVVFIYDVERLEPGEPEAAWAYLDTQRENLSAYPHCLVFWVTEKGARAAALHAPNTWSQRSGVFDFTVAAQPVVSQLRAAAADQPVRVDSVDDLDRLTRLYLGLLEEYQADEEVAPALLADLHDKAAYLLYRGDRYAESREHAEAERRISEALNDQRLRARALYRLGDVHVGLSELPEARARYEEALPLYRAIGDRLGEANCIKALGDVHVGLSELPEARARYEEALPLYRAIGARLGEANCIQSLGDVHVRLSELPEARARYEEALPLYRAIGDRLGEANTLGAMSRLALRLSEKDAQPLLDQAVSLHARIGSRYDVGVDYGLYAKTLIELGRRSEAKTFAEQARAAFAAVNMPVGVKWADGLLAACAEAS